tara:strand:- start:4425 stop:4622 length:198 start_codon:yes stop_codon:yes gene_type:complete
MAATKENFPRITKKQVDALDNLIPNKCPELLEPEREIWFNAGRRSVVSLLQEILAIQNDSTILKS